MSIKSVRSPYVLLLSLLVLLPACAPLDWIKDKLGIKSENAMGVSEGRVLAKVDGKPFMTADEFEKKYNTFIASHPLGQHIAAMPGIKRKIFDGLVAQKLISKYVVDQGLDQTPEYQEQLENVKQMINVRVFENKNAVKVSDADKRDFYEQYKDKMPELVISQGGVKAVGVGFATEADAKAFLEQAKGKGAELNKVAQENGAADKYQDFKVVNRYSIALDPTLRDKILALSKFPTLELIKGNDKKFYVVYAAAKEEPKVRSFEEAMPMIEQKLVSQKQEEANNKAVEQLKTDSKLDIDDAYFTEQEAQKQTPEEMNAQEQLEKLMAEEPAPEAAAKTKHSASTKTA